MTMEKRKEQTKTSSGETETGKQEAEEHRLMAREGMVTTTNANLDIAWQEA